MSQLNSDQSNEIKTIILDALPKVTLDQSQEIEKGTIFTSLLMNLSSIQLLLEKIQNYFNITVRSMQANNFKLVIRNKEKYINNPNLLLKDFIENTTNIGESYKQAILMKMIDNDQSSTFFKNNRHYFF